MGADNGTMGETGAPAPVAPPVLAQDPLAPSQREISEAAMERLMRVLPYVEVFTLTPLGEPLLYTGLDRLLERYEAAGCGNLQLTTNGNAMTEERARRLVEAGTRRIYFSIDTADPATYRDMRVGGDLSKATEAIAHLNDWKTRLAVPHPEIVLASTFMRRNIGDLPGLIRYAHANRIHRVSVQLMEAEDPAMEPETLAYHLPLTVESLREGRRAAEDLGVDMVIHLALRNLLSAHAAEPDVAALLGAQPALDLRGRRLMDKCLYPWTFLVVDTDGEARPCCWAAIRYGNLAEQTFDEVWNSPTAQETRKSFLADMIPPGCRQKHCRVDL
ncbi:MAG: radical SAM protein [Candidatus Sumerlaeota bacterium]|nr:radical SAM protein [Candidatus Sumerlaeota bacterium]